MEGGGRRWTITCAKRSEATPLRPAVAVAVASGEAMVAALYRLPSGGRAAAEAATRAAATLALIKALPAWTRVE